MVAAGLGYVSAVPGYRLLAGGPALGVTQVPGPVCGSKRGRWFVSFTCAACPVEPVEAHDCRHGQGAWQLPLRLFLDRDLNAAENLAGG